MAASLRQALATPPSAAQQSGSPQSAGSVLAAPAHAYLARLAALHNEAAETTYLANLLDRAPWAAAVLGVIAFATALAVAELVPVSGLATWLLLIAAGIAAIVRIHRRATVAPFERAPFKGLVQKLSATLLFAGFAWGAGFFLALPAGLGIIASTAFIAGISILVAGVLRAREMTFCFLAPTMAMGALGALMHPLGGTAVMLLAILVGGLVSVGAAILSERLLGPAMPRAPQAG
jgi:hypothetical protein